MVNFAILNFKTAEPKLQPVTPQTFEVHLSNF